MKSASRPALVLLLVLVALCWRHGWYEDYVFDDASLIGRNDTIKSVEYLPTLLGFGDAPVPSHRMIRNLSYALDYIVWGENLRGFHLTNVFIHLLNVVLVFGLTRRIMGDGLWAYLVALLWAVHPVQTDAVTYLSGRRDVLAALFYLWAFDRYLTWRTGEGIRLQLAWSLVLYVTGCFAKEVCVTLPAVVVLYEVVRARREDRDRVHPLATLSRQAVAQYLTAPVYYTLLALFPPAFTWYILRYHPYNVGAHYITGKLPTDWLSDATYGLHYLGLMVWPRGLTVDYFPESLPGSHGLADPATLAALAVLGVLAALTLVAIERGSHAGFGAGFFVLAFLPMTNLVIPSNEPVAMHYLYLPSVGFWIAAVAGVRALAGRRPAWRRPLVATLAVAALALFVRTDLRNREWENPEQLFLSSLEVFPRSSRMWNNLACEYMHQDRLADALRCVERAIELSPREALYHYNRAFAFRKQNRWADALVEYDRALKEAPDYTDAMIGRAFDLLQLKRFDDALHAYAEVLKVKENDPRGWYYHHWRGVAFRDKGDHESAHREFRIALDKGKSHPETLWQVALTYEAQAAHEPARAAEYRDEAAKLLVRAQERAPDSAVLKGVLGDLYRDMGKTKEALEQYAAMGQVNPEYTAEGALRRARLYRELGQREQAKAAYEEARSLEIKDPALEAYFAESGASPRSR